MPKEIKMAEDHRLHIEWYYIHRNHPAICRPTYNQSVKTQSNLPGICHIWCQSLLVYRCTGLLDHTVMTLSLQGHIYKVDSHLMRSGGRSCHGSVHILGQQYFSCSFHSVQSQGSHHIHSCLPSHYSCTLKICVMDFKMLWSLSTN